MSQILHTRLHLVLPLIVLLLGSTLQHSYSQMSNIYHDKHGNLLIPEFDSLTGGVKRIRGLKVNIADYGLTKDSLDELSVKEFGSKLFDDYQSITKIPSSQLLVKSVRTRKGFWFVGYDQLKDRIPIEYTNIGFTIGPNGDVIGFGAMGYTSVECSTTPGITPERAKEVARADLDASQVEFTGEPPLAIHPERVNSSFRFSLVWKVYISAISKPYGAYKYDIDANTGAILLKTKLSEE